MHGVTLHCRPSALASKGKSKLAAIFACPGVGAGVKGRAIMLSNLEQQPADALLALIKLYGADQRADKIDLGVGVYRTGQGATPVFGAIKAAERKLVETQESKAYLGPEGDMGFVHALMPYIFGQDDPTKGGRIEGMQAPGGTGAVRLAVALAKKAGVKRVWMGSPSWPNHAQICADLGLPMKSFNHAAADGTADMASLRAAIETPLGPLLDGIGAPPPARSPDPTSARVLRSAISCPVPEPERPRRG